ncbi:receptor-transporting protein 3-like [Corticium candelabrum]|uniref:receptor-transporting protein 3-like n=1 Tax=Corticium candelabrum TaxID=121492 RepID=UPI002E27552D|nr:receptor-transporting protein 3-like [Corticium candelabrum]
MAHIIREAMSDTHDLDPANIPDQYRYQNVYGRGTVHCGACFHSWSSYISWITVDLKKCRLARRFQQKCQSCETANTPYFKTEELERMIKLTIARVISLMNGTYDNTGTDDLNDTQLDAPHDSDRCEKCEYGEGRPCYE